MLFHSRAIIIRENQILLIFRRKQDKEYYVFPGGRVESDEVAEKAVVREVMEETNVSVLAGKLFCRIIDPNNEEHIFYLCRYLEGFPSFKNSEEEKRSSPDNYYEPKWISLKDLSKLLLYPLEVRDKVISEFLN
jgi:8-oxo-dGTP diphosphatase